MFSQENLIQLITQKYRNGELHHFIKMIPSHLTSSDEITLLVNKLIQNINIKEPVKNILHLKTEKKSFSVSEIKTVSSFTKYKAHNFPTKFIFVHEAEKLSLQCLNKLLKTLEEPEVQLICFFLPTYNFRFIETIESRCIHFSYNSTNQQQISWNELFSYPFHKFVKEFKDLSYPFHSLFQWSTSQLLKNPRFLIATKVQEIEKNMIHKYDLGLDISLELSQYQEIMRHLNKQ